MNRNVSIGLAVGITLIAGVTYFALRIPSDNPGAGKPAEIIDPVTLERHKTTWDKVISYKVNDTGLYGGWMAPVPGKGNDYWGYAVDPGQSHPCEKAKDKVPLNPFARPQ